MPDAFLCALASVVASVLYFSAFGGSFALNSDIVMPYVVHADLLAGQGALSGWIFPEAPYWFPDVLATWAIRSGTTLPVAVNIYAILQVGAFLVAARWVLRLVEPQRGTLAWRIFLLLWIAQVLTGLHAGDSWFDRLFHYVFVPYTHAGALVATLATLATVLAWQKHPGSRVLPVVLAALAVLMAVSDRLYVVGVLIPLLFVSMVPFLQRRIRIRVAGIAVVAFAASEAWRWTSGESAVASRYGPVSTPSAAFFQMAKDFAKLLSSDGVASALVVAGAAALALGSAKAWRRRRLGDEDAGSAVFAGAFLALSIALPIAASVVLGRHTAMDSFRYCQALGFLLLPLALGLERMVARQWATRAGTLVACALVAIMGTAVACGDTSEAVLKAEWRAQSDCLDQAQARYGLHNGLSRYWHANALNAQLRSASRLFAVMEDLESTPINKNMDWIGARALNARALPVLDFVDEFQFDAVVLDEAFGEPLAVVACPLSPIRIYLPGSGLLASLYGRNPWLPREALARFGRMAVPAAAWMRAPAVRDADGLRFNGNAERETPVLVGGIESLEARRLWIDYSLDGPSATARWEVVTLDRDGDVLGVVAEGRLDNSATWSHASFVLPAVSADARGIGVSVAGLGEIDLRIRAIGMSRD